MKAIMLDIETLGLRADSAIVQVGVCAADIRTGEYLVAPTNWWVNPVKGTDMDIGTVRWWMRQSDAARQAVFGKEDAHATAVPSVYWQLHDIYENRLGGKDAGVTVWASPAMFDLPMLTQTFSRAMKQRDAKPWPYHMERDLMTLYKMLDPEKKLKPTNPVEHDAASDAKAQMAHLIAIFQANQAILKGAI